MRPPGRRFDNVQYLRGLAALVVTLSHFITGFVVFPRVPMDNVVNGRVGVDAFFVISGFIMMTTSARNFGSADGALDFLYRRLVRIVPLYWIATAFAVLLRLGENNAFSVKHLANSLLFLPDGALPVLGVGWTLNLEMLFYALFFVTMFLKPKAGLAVLTAVLVVLPLARKLLHAHQPPWITWMDPAVWEFLGGMGLAVLARRGHRSSAGRFASPVVLSGMLLVLAWWVSNTFRTPFVFNLLTGVSVTAVAVLGANVAPSGWVLRGLERLGNASYSLYLVHAIVLGACRQAIMLVPGQPRWLLAACLPLVFVVAWLVHTRVETPLLRRFTRRRDPLPVAAQVA